MYSPDPDTEAVTVALPLLLAPPVPDANGYSAFGSRSFLRVKIESDGVQPRGQAFWDPQQELLEYHVIPHGPYDSFLQGEALRIDTDEAGHPVFVELSWNRALHQRVRELRTPKASRPGLIRFLDLRVRFSELKVMSTVNQSTTCIIFKEALQLEYWAVGRCSLWGIDGLGHLSELWVIDAKSDPSGLRRARWRSESWKRVRRGALRGSKAGAESISPSSAGKHF